MTQLKPIFRIKVSLASGNGREHVYDFQGLTNSEMLAKVQEITTPMQSGRLDWLLLSKPSTIYNLQHVESIDLIVENTPPEIEEQVKELGLQAFGRG